MYSLGTQCGMGTEKGSVIDTQWNNTPRVFPGLQDAAVKQEALPQDWVAPE